MRQQMSSQRTANKRACMWMWGRLPAHRVEKAASTLWGKSHSFMGFPATHNVDWENVCRGRRGTDDTFPKIISQITTRCCFISCHFGTENAGLNTHKSKFKRLSSHVSTKHKGTKFSWKSKIADGCHVAAYQLSLIKLALLLQAPWSHVKMGVCGSYDCCHTKWSLWVQVRDDQMIMIRKWWLKIIKKNKCGNKITTVKYLERLGVAVTMWLFVHCSHVQLARIKHIQNAVKKVELSDDFKPNLRM